MQAPRDFWKAMIVASLSIALVIGALSISLVIFLPEMAVLPALGFIISYPIYRIFRGDIPYEY